MEPGTDSKYPTHCAKADSCTTPPSVRARRAIITSASGNEVQDTPIRNAQTQGKAAGASHRPAKPDSPNAASPTTSTPWLRILPAMVGNTSETGTPIAMATAKSSPATLEETPASRKICDRNPMAQKITLT